MQMNLRIIQVNISWIIKNEIVTWKKFLLKNREAFSLQQTDHKN